MSWEFRCPHCGLVEPAFGDWPKEEKRCWRELPSHTTGRPPQACKGTGLLIESEFFEQTIEELKLETDIMRIMRGVGCGQ